MSSTRHLYDEFSSRPVLETRSSRPTDLRAAALGFTDRDHDLIAYLATHQVLTATQITRLLFDSAHTARHRLAALHRCDVLARFRRRVWPGSQPWRYTLGPVGAVVHAAMTDAPVPRPSTVERAILRVAYSAHTEHLIGVNDFFTTLAWAGRHNPGAALTEWSPSSVVADACAGIVRPDGYGEYTDAYGALGFFLEYDTGTETLTTVTDKLRKYGELARTGIVTRPVLFHLPSPARERHLHEAITRRWGRHRLPVPVATTAHPLNPATTRGPHPARATARGPARRTSGGPTQLPAPEPDLVHAPDALATAPVWLPVTPAAPRAHGSAPRRVTLTQLGPSADTGPPHIPAPRAGQPRPGSHPRAH